MLNYFGVNIETLDSILKTLFYIWAVSGVLLLIFSSMFGNRDNDIVMGNIIACFIPVRNTFLMIMYAVNLIRIMSEYIVDLFKGE